MKKVIMPLLAIVAILTTVGLFGVNSANAASCGCGCNGQCANGLKVGKLGMIEYKAQILGLTVDQIKTRLSNGETMRDIIEKSGLNLEQYREKMQEKMQGLKNEIRSKTNCSCSNPGSGKCGLGRNK